MSLPGNRSRRLGSPVLDEDTEIPGEQILLDSNAEAEGHEFFALGAALVSLDGNLLAYSVDIVGDERYTLRFKDLRGGERLPDEIADIAAGVTWSADNRTVYYLTLDAAHRPDKVWRYRLGSGEPAELVYHEADERFWLGAGLTRSEVRAHRLGVVHHLGGTLRGLRRSARTVHRRAAAA